MTPADWRLLAWILVPLSAAGISLWGLLRLRELWRAWRLRRLAARHRFESVTMTQDRARLFFDGLNHLLAGHTRRFRHAMSRTAGTRSVVFADHHYLRGTRNERTRARSSVIYVHDPGLALPHFWLEPRDDFFGSHRLASWLRRAVPPLRVRRSRVDPGGCAVLEEIDLRHELRTLTEREVTPLIDAAVADRLAPLEGFCVEARDQRVAVFTASGRARVRDLPRLFTEAQALADQLAANSTRAV